MRLFGGPLVRYDHVTKVNSLIRWQREVGAVEEGERQDVRRGVFVAVLGVQDADGRVADLTCRCPITNADSRDRSKAELSGRRAGWLRSGFLAVAAPWHILAALRNPAQGNVRGFLWFYFVNEHILRFLNRRVPRDYDKVPLLLFWALLVLWLIPWTVFLPQSLREVPRRWREFRSQMTRRQRAYLLFFLWTFVIVGFFSLSTRQEYYTIPAIPAMALLVGGWLQRERASAADSRERRSGMISSAVLWKWVGAPAPGSMTLRLAEQATPCSLPASVKRR